MKKQIVIIGATSAIAEHCARLWADEGDVNFHLVGRDSNRLERVANDLKIRKPACTVQTATINLHDPGSITGFVQSLYAGATVDVVLIAHGSLPDQFVCQDNLVLCKETLDVNGISPVLFAEAFAHQMSIKGQGTLVIIGSVAGDRGRRSNYIYGAAKGLVTRYAQGLQHRFAGTAIKVILIKPGPTATPMTAHLSAQGAKLAPVEDVAHTIVKGVASGKTVVYAPGKWQIIMMIIQHLPSFIFNRMNI